tara:strand:+ start:202 stop:564 length:363 start_codon:yes stop_codon:yes gene_type:complete
MKSLAAVLLLAAATPAVARDWAPNMNASMPTEGDAWAIRRCEDYGPTTMDVKAGFICFQQEFQKTFDLERFPAIPPFTVTRERTRRINCEYASSYRNTAGDVARKYCPQVTVLPPAPFLR